MAHRQNYIKKRGSLREAAQEANAPMSQSLSSGLSGLNQLADQVQESVPTQMYAPPMARRALANIAPPPGQPDRTRAGGGQAAPDSGRDTTPFTGTAGMFFYTVPDGQRVLSTDSSGTIEVIIGPGKVLRYGKRFQAMQHYVAHPGEFLIVRYRDGRQEHLSGPSECWFDPRDHLSVEKQDAVQIADKEAVVVYAEDADGQVTRRIVYGPATFVPGPAEWLHTFSWHGPAADGSARKVPGAMVFQKLWQMPDQMYHDVDEVRTADDAQLTVKLMIFFELTDIERMLESTHDPIGDFVNAATSDVVEFLSRRDFDAFKADTDKLNEIETYKQLTARAAQCGYRLNKVVYRGYAAPPALQQLHDQATQNRVRLQLERATERQAQEIVDQKLELELARGEKNRLEEERAQGHKLTMQERALAAHLSSDAQRRAASREQKALDEQAVEVSEAARQAREREHLADLKAMGVDLTALLTQSRADKVIELRGDARAHVHLPPDVAG